MAQFLVRLRYSPEVWRSVLRGPADREAAAAQVISELGGSLEALWIAGGTLDIFVLLAAGDRTVPGALAMFDFAVGVAREIEIVELHKWCDLTEAFERAAAVLERVEAN